MEGVATRSVQLGATKRKLGIVIENTGGDGHTIVTIKPDSPLTAFVSPGDIIVGIDAMDTRHLSGASLTALLIRSCATAKGTLLQIAASSAKKNVGETETATTTSPDSVRDVVVVPTIESDFPGVVDAAPVSIASALTKPSRIMSDTRTVVAPPGKLGIVLATAVDGGHVITNVKPGSSLEGLVSEGERIVGVDDRDTRQLSVVALTALLSRTAKEERTFHIVGAGELENDESRENEDNADEAEEPKSAHVTGEADVDEPPMDNPLAVELTGIDAVVEKETARSIEKETESTSSSQSLYSI